MTRFLALVHPAAGTALISEWLTGTPDRSRTAADAVADEWAAAEAPPGRLAQHVFLSAEGDRLLFHAQWTGDDAHLAWARARRGEVVSRVDTLVPGIERPGLARTRLRRSVVHDAASPAATLVLTRTAAAEAERLAAPVPGLLAAHVHVTPDGERALVITEWATAGQAPPGERYALYRSLVDQPVRAGRDAS
ncbi:antibiotic biosynthesis monooxygenase [Streptomyces sp. MS19]